MIGRDMMKRGLAAIAVAVMMAAGAPALADVKEGVEAWDRGDYKKAVEEWRRAAVAGDPGAQFDLGQAYKLGRGVPVDFALAEQWYGKAALQGLARAEDSYGLALFQNGKHDEAVPWLEKAVARGEPRAQLVLGTMLFNGDSVKRDWVRAYALLTRSSAAGLPQGSQTLAQMDQYISADIRQQGITLARQYETQGERPGYVPEVIGQSSGGAPRGAELPASAYAGDSDRPPTLTPTPTRQAKRQPQRLPSPDVQTAMQEPPVQPPAPAPVVASRVASRSASGSGWRLQFGAFRDGGNARALWQQLQAKVGPLNGFDPIYARMGALTALQTGPLASDAEAARLCSAVKARMPSTPCVSIAP